jgi:N-methylhydantoinase A
MCAELERRALETLRRGRLSTAHVTFSHSVEARYVGQNFELNVPIPSAGDGATRLDAIRASFDAAHRRFYGYDQPSKEIELVTFRLRASMPGPKVDLTKMPTTSRAGALTAAGQRSVVFAAGTLPVECPIFDRLRLLPGDVLEGPAIVEQMDTTTLLPPDFKAAVDLFGNLLLTRR